MNTSIHPALSTTEYAERQAEAIRQFWLDRQHPMFTCHYLHHMYRGYCGPGFIYVAQHEDVYKIGCTKIGGKVETVFVSWGIFAGVHSRLLDLRKLSGQPFRLIHLIYTPVCVKGVEFYIHTQLAHARLEKRERFALDLFDLAWLFALDTFDGYPLNHMEAELCHGE